MPRSAYPATRRGTDRGTGSEHIPLSPRVRARQAASRTTSDGHGPFTMWPHLVSPSLPTGRALAMAQRRVKVALLVEEEGLERGAATRIAGWLGVSPSTIGRDVKALVAAGHPTIVAALDRAHRRRENGTVASKV